MTTRWRKMTPDRFRFTSKAPQSVTHEKRLGARRNEADDIRLAARLNYDPDSAKVKVIHQGLAGHVYYHVVLSSCPAGLRPD